MGNSARTLGLALGGGGARGLAHIHVLSALDELGLRPDRIAGSSIGAMMGAAFAAGLSGAELAEHTLSVLARKRLVLSRLWRTRPANLSEFMADGGLRLGQLNAVRVLAAFMPPALPETFEALAIPLTVVATDFYAGAELAIRSGTLLDALAASAALPAVFRPVLRDGIALVDGGIVNPLPFDVLCQDTDIVLAVDVTGGPEPSEGRTVPKPIEAMAGASQLMMGAIIAAKLKTAMPTLLVRPAVSRYGVLDFLRARTILAETAGLKEEVKRELGALLDGKPRHPSPSKPQPSAAAGI